MSDQLSGVTNNYNNGNGRDPWYYKVLKDFGFPVFVSVILLGGFAWIGQWMVSNQTRLIDSTIATNSSLTKANEENSKTLSQMRDTLQQSSAVVLRAVESNGDTLKSQSQVLAHQTKLLEERTQLFQQMADTHSAQTQNLEKLTTLMEDAQKLMEPAPKQRADSLLKQDQTNEKLDELIQEFKKKP